MAAPARASSHVAPRGRRRLSGAQRRASIIEAAARVFAERGYEAARIEEIAAAAGVSKALIYEHFEGKQELFTEIVRDGTADALSRVAAEAARPDRGSVERLELGFGAFLDFLAERPHVWRVITQDVSDPTILELDQSMRRQAVTAIGELLKLDPAVEKQRVEDVEIVQGAEMITGATISLASWWIDNPSVPRESVLESLMTFMWLGLERFRGGERYAAPSGLGGRIASEDE